MKRFKFLYSVPAALAVVAVAESARACGAFCPREGSTGLLGLGLFTAVGLLGAAWIFARKPDERR